ncbi:hypothetical protein B0H10DRAFT_2213259 [Mycena sp. CBHHK59/15]|nr:hypothetical protein B0H10DRAFT_2213259 [Mycena sp. CBHHK59/15]
MEQMIIQLAKAILIARRMFPNTIIHWVFDNSSAHGSLAKNALTVTKMNVNPGGKVPEMRETVIRLDNLHGHGGKPQKMVFDNPLPDNHPHKKFEGQPKGMKVILAECGYTTNTNGKPLIGDCKACKASKARKPHLDGASPDEEAEMYGEDGNDSDEEEERPVDCCMRRLVSHQSDFAGEKSQLELLIEAAPGKEGIDPRDASNAFGALMQPDNDDADGMIDDLHRANIQAMKSSSNSFFAQPPRHWKVVPPIKMKGKLPVKKQLEKGTITIEDCEEPAKKAKKPPKKKKHLSLSGTGVRRPAFLVHASLKGTLPEASPEEVRNPFLDGAPTAGDHSEVAS